MPIYAMKIHFAHKGNFQARYLEENKPKAPKTIVAAPQRAVIIPITIEAIEIPFFIEYFPFPLTITIKISY
jgi:hypothetical protein